MEMVSLATIQFPPVSTKMLFNALKTFTIIWKQMPLLKQKSKGIWVPNPVYVSAFAYTCTTHTLTPHTQIHTEI